MTIENNYWELDVLNRKSVSEFIYSVVNSTNLSKSDDNALIFSIDGEWGSGKTHFINCWMKDLSAKGHPVLRFDAWENDLSEDPFVALMSEFNKSISLWTDKLTIDKTAKRSLKEESKKILKSAASAFIPSVKAIITHQVKKHAGDELSNLFDSDKPNSSTEESSGNLSKSALEIIEKEFKNQLDSHQVRQKSISALKKISPKFQIYSPKKKISGLQFSYSLMN